MWSAITRLLLGPARAALADHGRRLLASGLVVGTAGNISVRDGDLVAVTPSGVPYTDIGPADMVVVDPSTGRIVDGSRAATSELPMHLAIYRARPEVRAIVHTHSPAATALSVTVDELPAIHYAIVALGGAPVRVADYACFGSEDLATALVEALDRRTGALMAHHGVTTIGADLDEAFERAVTLEWLSDVYIRAIAAGAGRPPKVLSETQLAEVRAAAAARQYPLLADS